MVLDVLDAQKLSIFFFMVPFARKLSRCTQTTGSAALSEISANRSGGDQLECFNRYVIWADKWREILKKHTRRTLRKLTGVRIVSVATELDSNLNGLDDSTLASEGAWFHWLSIFNRWKLSNVHMVDNCHFILIGGKRLTADFSSLVELLVCGAGCSMPISHILTVIVFLFSFSATISKLSAHTLEELNLYTLLFVANPVQRWKEECASEVWLL